IFSLASRGSSNLSPSPAPRLLLPPRLLLRRCGKRNRARCGTEVEKREWKREQLASYDREEMPCASSFDEIMRQQRISSTDRKEGEASMGLDRTLDDEDEEDEYDKVALGKENGGEDVSMEDAISRPCGVRIRDPRANHATAKMRLKEDELEANK
uniref:Uncharacterized protein n=1 Tax=Brassica oleracea var. oleracea TaxID=109376 RepID=A0A0D3DTG4_BRAOL